MEKPFVYVLNFIEGSAKDVGRSFPPENVGKVLEALGERVGRWEAWQDIQERLMPYLGNFSLWKEGGTTVGLDRLYREDRLFARVSYLTCLAAHLGWEFYAQEAQVNEQTIWKKYEKIYLVFMACLVVNTYRQVGTHLRVEGDDIGVLFRTFLMGYLFLRGLVRYDLLRMINPMV